MCKSVALRTPDDFLAKYGPWAVVTGASSGIGREIAIRLAEAKLDLVLVARRREALDRLAGNLTASAGFGTSGAFLDADRDEECDMLDVNCRAVMVLAQHFGARLVARGRGGVVLMGSLVGRQGAVPTFNALGRRTSVAPGALSKVLTLSLARLPRSIWVRVMETVTADMTGAPGS